MSYVWSANALASKFARSGAVANLKSKTILLPDGTTIPRPKTMSQVPDLQDLPPDQALFIARQQPHVIPRADGGYVGAPRDIRTTRQLNNQRGSMDAEIDAGAAGGDWYDRYRNAILAVTNTARDGDWMAAIQGMMSAGVSPESELAFALKHTNSAIAQGANPATTTVARFPAQTDSGIAAAQANDVSRHQLGSKTREYARLINPRQAGNFGVTGVNDFRYLRTLGFKQADGSAQSEGVGSTSHTYAHYETALGVDRANIRMADGRATWTGEQIQAAPWVKQKGDDFFERQKTGYLKKARARLKDQGVTNVTDAYIDRVGRQISFEEASRTIGDYYPKHTAFATYEAQPFTGMGHLPDLQTASKAEQDAFAMMPQSTWANSPGGLDDIYSNMRLGETGVVMKALPTTKMQGVYTPPGGVPEANLGEVARPLVAFDTAKNKTMPADDMSLLRGGEAARAFIDAQGAAAFHKPFKGLPSQAPFSNSIFASTGSPGPTPIADFGILGEIGRQRNLPDVIDTGQGVTLTNFDNPLTMADEIKYGAVDDAFIKKNNKILNKAGDLKLSAGEFKDISAELEALGYREADRVNISSDYIPMFELDEGYGSGAVTGNLLGIMDALPKGTYDSINANPQIPMNAVTRAMRDQDLASSFGGVRGDLQNARRIIGEGPGWIDRLRQAMKDGTIPLPVGVFALSQSIQPENPDAN